MKIPVTNNNYHLKTIPIADRTVIQRYLPKRIPTFLAMERKALKMIKLA